MRGNSIEVGSRGGPALAGNKGAQGGRLRCLRQMNEDSLWKNYI